MASTDLKRLRTKYDLPYDSFDIKMPVSSLLSDIFVENQQEVSDYIFNKNNKALKKGKLTLPKSYDISNAIRLKKIKENGKTLSANLRNKIIDNLKQVLSQPYYVKSKGKEKGQIKDKVAIEFEKLMKETFKNYAKIDPRYGIPANIKAIAVTEVQASVNDAKHEYMNTLLEQNPKAKIKKTWIHNIHLLKKRIYARLHHRVLNGVTIGVNKRFKIKSPTDGIVYALYPHDPELPVGEIVSCHCECLYEVE